MKTLLKAFIVVMPWFIKRRLLISLLGYNLHPGARIQLAWIFPAKLRMEEGALIGHFNTAIHLDEIIMERNTSIARNNWITGFSSTSQSAHFQHQPDRRSSLTMMENSAITKNHHIDCTSPIHIGKFTTIAGYQSQLLTHSIDIFKNRQDSHPIKIGDYCFVGTNVTILGGSELPDYSVLGAKSLLNKPMEDSYSLFAGVPAKKIKELPSDAAYFLRTEGFVY